jgi:glycine cleavage system aminomethyltransferase T
MTPAANGCEGNNFMATAPPPLARTPLHSWHAAHGARFVTSNGWYLPALYSTVERETAAACTGLALADVSAVVKFSLLGPGVPAAAQALAGDGPAPQGRAVLQWPGENRILACHLTADHLLLLAATCNPAVLRDRLAQLPAGLALVRNDATTAQAGFYLAGLHIDDMLRHLTTLDISPARLPAGSCAETGLAGVHALLVRPPASEPPSFQVYVAWDLAEYVWERLLDAGRPWGIVPLGWEALRTLGLAAF